jgi:predicted dehydrogenase
LKGAVDRCELTAVCDGDPEQLKRFPEVSQYHDSGEMIRGGEIDAILIATPHYSHTTIGRDAFEHNLHVLTEKPISVHKADCERLIEAAQAKPDKVFCAMFQQRTVPQYRKVRQMIADGELGKIHRAIWYVTNWFRSENYYASGGWRATWAGEGGGVLLNQCPHQLDLYQWILGMMPSKVRAFCQFGKYHDIEVEDDVTAYMEFPNGATGVFITTTGEAPGTNRFEIQGERGKLTLEGGQPIKFIRNEVEISEFSRTTSTRFNTPPTWDITIDTPGEKGPGHMRILQNFVDAILDGTELLAPAAEGINSVELANSMLYSAWTDSTVDMPLDGAAYEKLLNERIANSTFQKKTVAKGDNDDFGASF